MIEVNELTKVFRKPIRGNGLSGMVKTLFSRKYDEVRAVDGISFTVPDGQIVGYIGANGAGKSTTIKMMCGILTPTSGSVRIDGTEPYRRAAAGGPAHRRGLRPEDPKTGEKTRKNGYNNRAALMGLPDCCLTFGCCSERDQLSYPVI